MRYERKTVIRRTGRKREEDGWRILQMAGQEELRLCFIYGHGDNGEFFRH